MSLFDVYPLFDVTLEKAKGIHVYDDNNQQYLDLYGGHAVISIGHGHPNYINELKGQMDKIGFYSNSVQNPVQERLAKDLIELSSCKDYQLFMCNSGAEANENALKLASFHTGKKKVVAFKNGFHGRTSAAVAATDNPKIIAPINAQQDVELVELGDTKGLENILKQGDVCAVIIEFIQGVGGLDQGTAAFFEATDTLCKTYGACLIADEVQAGFGRSGQFFAFQNYKVTPEIISMAKGMGNGFPVGGVLIHPNIKASYGLLGTTFGGNHLACAATLAVIETLKEEKLMHHALQMETYFRNQAQNLKGLKAIKGRGLMLGLEFDFPIATLRKRLIFEHHIFTGSAKNPNVIRILPPLNIQKTHIEQLVNALQTLL